MVAMVGSGAALRRVHRLRRWQAKVSTATALGIPSEDQGLGEGDGGVAVKLGYVHGSTATRAQW